MKKPKPRNWFMDQRQIWILECLRIFGYINRSHIIRKFAISIPQASADLQYLANSGMIQYNKELKRYELAK